MSSTQLTCTRNELQFFRTAYPTLDQDVVETVVRSLKGDTDAIIQKLQELAFVPTDTETLRACAMSVAKNRDTPALHKKNAKGDGRCLFHALAQCLSAQGNQTLGTELYRFTLQTMRVLEGGMLAQTINFLRAENKSSQKSDQELLRDHIKGLQGGEWGGEIELQILAETLALTIHIWSPFNEYARSVRTKDPSRVNVLQVSQNADYVLYGTERCIGRGEQVVHLLYTGGCHYDSLLKD
jgi:hypothetical protein